MGQWGSHYKDSGLRRLTLSVSTQRGQVQPLRASLASPLDLLLLQMNLSQVLCEGPPPCKCWGLLAIFASTFSHLARLPQAQLRRFLQPSLSPHVYP